MSPHYDKLIIDGNNFLFRAFFIKRPAKIVNGIDMTPISQFLHMFKSICSRFNSSQVYLTWDKKIMMDSSIPIKKNFRKELVPYKEQRVESERTIKIFDTITHIQKFMDAMGIKTIYPVSMEADDVIRYACKGDESAIIISNDRDLLQLINDHVTLFLPNKDIIVDVNNFNQIAGVKQEMFLLYKSIMGDVSDNITGLDKFGPVRAKALSEKLFENGVINYGNDELTQEQKAIIKRNLTVVDLAQTEIIYPEEYEFYKIQDKESDKVFNVEGLKDLFHEYGCHYFLRTFGEWNLLFNKNMDENDLLSRISM
jgi:5'-3' exonuclease